MGRGFVAIFSSLILSSIEAQACRCSTVNDFESTAATLVARSKSPDKYLMVQAQVKSVPTLHPTWGYPLTTAVELEIQESNDQTIPVDVVLKFPFSGSCDANPSLFELDQTYMILLQRTGDPERPFSYPGNPCDQAMVKI